jgi:hypothetical protein
VMVAFVATAVLALDTTRCPPVVAVPAAMLLPCIRRNYFKNRFKSPPL